MGVRAAVGTASSVAPLAQEEACSTDVWPAVDRRHPQPRADTLGAWSFGISLASMAGRPPNTFEVFLSDVAQAEHLRPNTVRAYRYELAAAAADARFRGSLDDLCLDNLEHGGREPPQQLALLPGEIDKTLFFAQAATPRSWKRAHLAFVTPETVVRWHGQGWRLFWRWTSRSAADVLISALKCGS
jgi:hypothetical protein